MVKPAVYTVGSTCLAKVKGYPPWPAIVKDIQPGTDRDGSFSFFLNDRFLIEIVLIKRSFPKRSFS